MGCESRCGDVSNIKTECSTMRKAPVITLRIQYGLQIQYNEKSNCKEKLSEFGRHFLDNQGLPVLSSTLSGIFKEKECLVLCTLVAFQITPFLLCTAAELGKYGNK